jgi:competence protein ComFC
MQQSFNLNFLHKTKLNVSKWKNDLLHLVYPDACLICSLELPSSDIQLCHVCEQNLRYTYYETYKEASSLDKLFWGRLDLNATFALLHFEKQTSTQDILHQIKYKNKTQLAEEMGVRIGKKLQLDMLRYGNIDTLIPIPMHPKKQYMRGYNQSELIAEGISKETNIPVNTEFLTKINNTESQTKKGRFLRWDNVSEVFEVNVKKLKGVKHLAIVDDVVTTGSTIEACILKIKKELPEIKITVISLAATK